MNNELKYCVSFVNGTRLDVYASDLRSAADKARAWAIENWGRVYAFALRRARSGRLGLKVTPEARAVLEAHRRGDVS
ncbi:hypothetical protein ES703_44112 [subsurface metagenome]